MDFRGQQSPASVGWQSLQLPPGQYHDGVSRRELDWFASVWVGRHVTDSIDELIAERDRLKREVQTYRSDKGGWQLDARSVQIEQHLSLIAEELLKLKQSPPQTLASEPPPKPTPEKRPPQRAPQNPHKPPLQHAHVALKPGQQDAFKKLQDEIAKAYANDPRIQKMKNLEDEAVAARATLAQLVGLVRNPQGRDVSDDEVRRAMEAVLSALHESAKLAAEVEKEINVKTKGHNDWFLKRMGVNQNTGLEDIADAASAVQDRTVDSLEKKYGVAEDQPSAPSTRDDKNADLQKVMGTERQLQEFGENKHKSPQGLIMKVVQDDRADIEKRIDGIVMRIGADPYSVGPVEINMLMMDITTAARQTAGGGIPYTSPQDAARRISDARQKWNAARQGAAPQN